MKTLATEICEDVLFLFIDVMSLLFKVAQGSRQRRQPRLNRAADRATDGRKRPAAGLLQGR